MGNKGCCVIKCTLNRLYISFRSMRVITSWTISLRMYGLTDGQTDKECLNYSPPMRPIQPKFPFARSRISHDTSHVTVYVLSLKYYSFPKRQVSDSSKLKQSADDNFRFDESSRIFSKRVENTVGKGEIPHYEQFLLFLQCFQKTYTRHVKTRDCLGKG